MKNIEQINLGTNGPLVSKLGLGCMRMSSIWGGPTPDETESIATIQAARLVQIDGFDPSLAAWMVVYRWRTSLAL